MAVLKCVYRRSIFHKGCPLALLVVPGGCFLKCIYRHLILGEAMEKGLRECCRSIRIGKLLIRSEEETSKPTVT